MASFSSGSGQEDEVLVEEKSFVRTLILNRPKQLNSASRYMISRLLELFLVYEKDSNVKLVILKGKGRAFCAGGDVAALVHDINNGNWKSCAIVSWKVFTLNYLMATYSKPQVSILNGIVMGGGAGCSIHGSLRVATENSVFAMPETALGLFPDTGASYFLSRLPGHFGEYLGLTGARVDGAEMLACGLATHFVPSAKLPSLEAALHTVDSSDKAIISAVIGQYSELPMLKEQSAYRRSDVINRCFSRRTVEDILSALEREATNKVDDWIHASLQSLKKASPTSLKISLRSIREGRLQGIGQCLVREYRMVCHVMQGEVSKDFVEGCRALLLDKDKNPKWEPPRLELVSEKMVDKYFSKVDDEDWEDLKLPARSNLPASAIAKL
ncbi:3-hydroxyisobutyryl-CoA hydrolase 1-like isoform X1 [Syzygium oleosum]|uniref:3-hydroxyisobutyryl-CoA hydrolase 1-like isoform X1 n=1 Tax=Syzygium oleosum TaxID=219896 RepID=UPI0011D26345|nr:3-hydroxyisobutyryl-CoA hydrolase 1-like isoform X1 [Syzygium oleosum]